MVDARDNAPDMSGEEDRVVDEIYVEEDMKEDEEDLFSDEAATGEESRRSNPKS